VSKVFVELEFFDNVLEVPALADTQHEDEEHEADGVPQQPGLVLNPTMNLCLGRFA